MGNRVDLRIEALSKAELEVYFCQNGRRSHAIYLIGGEEEVQVKDSFITESLCAWADIRLHQEAQSEKGQPGWMVRYKTNVVGGEIAVALEKVKQSIEMAIQKGSEAQIDITDDLEIPGWTIEWIGD